MILRFNNCGRSKNIFVENFQFLTIDEAELFGALQLWVEKSWNNFIKGLHINWNSQPFSSAHPCLPSELFAYPQAIIILIPVPPIP